MICKRFEYRVYNKEFTSIAEAEMFMNQLGSEGWEFLHTNITYEFRLDKYSCTIYRRIVILTGSVKRELELEDCDE